jgi:hypothetical protein
MAEARDWHMTKSWPAGSASCSGTYHEDERHGDAGMAGWLRVAADDVATEDELAKWVEIGHSYARVAAAEAPPTATAW